MNERKNKGQQIAIVQRPDEEPQVMMPLSVFRDLAMQVVRRTRDSELAKKDADKLFDALMAESAVRAAETNRLLQDFLSVVRARTSTEFASAVEDAADRIALEAARAADEKDLPLDLVKRLDSGNHPVKVYREHRGLTQSDLAELADLSKIYISQIETGRRGGSTKALSRIARALDVSLDDLAAWNAES